MQTDKAVRVLADNDCDTPQWNEALSGVDGAGWFAVSWLLAECYMYRRIYEALLGGGLGKYDPFCEKKRQSFTSSVTAADQLAIFAKKAQVSPDSFNILVQV
jgi:hypothetical protein